MRNFFLVVLSARMTSKAKDSLLLYVDTLNEDQTKIASELIRKSGYTDIVVDAFACVENQHMVVCQELPHLPSLCCPYTRECQKFETREDLEKIVTHCANAASTDQKNDA